MDIAILADGGMVLQKIKEKMRIPVENRDFAYKLRSWLTSDIPAMLAESINQPVSLFRVYYYDCFPFAGTVPDLFGRMQKVAQDPARKPFLLQLSSLEGIDFRSGRMSVCGWKLKEIDRLSKINDENGSSYRVTQDDFVPNYVQKMVDSEIVLDIVRLTKFKSVQSLVFLTADEDFVPAIKYAKDRGIRVYLMPLGTFVTKGLLSSVDSLLQYDLDNRSSPSLYPRPKPNSFQSINKPFEDSIPVNEKAMS